MRLIRGWRVLVGVLPVTVAACVGTVDAPTTEPDPIEVFAPYREREADHLDRVLAGFEERADVEVRYVGSGDFVRDLLDRTTDRNDPPDVAIVPQLGVIDELIESGQLTPFDDDTRDRVDAAVAEEAIVTVDGAYYGMPWRVTVKSLVWYRPDVFEEYGWSVPGTLRELTDLVNRIQGGTETAPWCFGIGAGASTGWAATDWLEDLVVRLTDEPTYERWTAGELPFADAEITAAFTAFEDLVLNAGRIGEERRALAEIPVDEAWAPLLADPPGCALYKQADFAIGWMPDDVTVGPDGDIDFFVLPGDDSSGPPPVVVGGDVVVQFRGGAPVDDLVAYLASPAAASRWIEQGGFLSPNRLVEADDYDDGHLREISELLAGDHPLVYDASDRMPASIGTDVLWTEITAWVTGASTYEALAEEVDAAFATARDERS